MNRPVFLRHKIANLTLAFDHQSQRHALHAARALAAGGSPQKGRDLIAHQAIENAAGLLGIDELHVDGARLREGGLNIGGRDGVKAYALRTHLGFEGLQQMPGDRFAFTIGIGGEIEFARVG